MVKNIVIAVIVIAVVAVGYLYWTKWRGGALTPQEQVLQNAGDAADVITQSATQGVLPSLGTQANPLQNQPDINPATKVNPFSNVKTNPFE